MRLSGKGIALTVFLAVLAAVIGTCVSAHFILQQRHTPSLHTYVHKELDLTAQQDRRIDAIEKEFAARRRARETELHAANAQLAAAIQARHEYTPEVQAAVNRFHSAMGELQKETILHVLAMRKVLTPEQAAKFDGRIGEALTHHAP